MKALVIFMSMHHGNTGKVARAIAPVLNARLLKLDEAKPSDLNGIDLVGFGSGTYGSGLHKKLFEFVESLPAVNATKAFVFSTSGGGKQENNAKFVEKLKEKGFRLVGQFACKGLITWGPFKLFGGGSKGHPSKEDLDNAKSFAESLRQG